MTPAPVVLFDTYSLVFRAHHALPPMNTASGEPTSALYGFSTQLLKILREQRPSGLAFALDAPRATFRHARDPGYKGQREAAPSALVRQFERLDALLRALGVPLYCAPGYEADDVLATLATALEAAGTDTLVVSGDRDLLQLVSPLVKVWFVGGRGQKPVLYDLERVRERFGVAPADLPAWAALVGDNSDNLPGVPGVGPRTASRLIQEFGGIEPLLTGLDRVAPEKLRAALGANQARIRLNEELSRLDRRVPLAEGPPALPLEVNGYARLRELFEELEFKSLLPRVDALAPASQSSSDA